MSVQPEIISNKSQPSQEQINQAASVRKQILDWYEKYSPYVNSEFNTRPSITFTSVQRVKLLEYLPAAPMGAKGMRPAFRVENISNVGIWIADAEEFLATHDQVPLDENAPAQG